MKFSVSVNTSLGNQQAMRAFVTAYAFQSQKGKDDKINQEKDKKSVDKR